MPAAALVLYMVWFLLAFGLRTVLQLRRTGDSGWRANRLPGQTGSTEQWAGLLFVVALAIGLAAPIADLLGLAPVANVGWVRGAGVAIASLGILLTFIAQVSMGDSWRIGVDDRERTSLVVDGVFEIVRNPIYSAMFVTACGLALMVPNVIAIAGIAALLLALELQVRGVEEPYLLSIHGSSYAGYAAEVGRFAPRLGRIDR